MALPLLNSLHRFKIHDHEILMVNPSIPKASLNVVIALTGVHSFVLWNNQSAVDRAEDNGPSHMTALAQFPSTVPEMKCIAYINVK